MERRNISCATGTVDVEVGMRFLSGVIEWEIVAFSRTHSGPDPLSLNPVILCKPLGELPSWWKEWADKDGNLEWCGDSVAACILANQDGKPRSARGDYLVRLAKAEGK